MLPRHEEFRVMTISDVNDVIPVLICKHGVRSRRLSTVIVTRYVSLFHLINVRQQHGSKASIMPENLNRSMAAIVFKKKVRGYGE